MRAVLLASLLAGLLGMTACLRQETPVVAGIRDQILLLGNGAEPEDLDPHVTSGMPEFNILSAIFEGLVSFEPRTLEPAPGAAERWEVSPDQLTYRFFLQPDGRWSNGDPVTAHDFVFSWRRVLSPPLGSLYTYLYEGIVNAAEFNRGEVPWEEVGIRAVDERIFEVVLEQPIPHLLSLLTHNSFFPVHRATIEAHGRMDQRGTGWTRPGSHVGNGPFVLHTWRHQAHIEVRPNPHYWDRKTIRLNAVRFFPIESADTEERAFRSGQLHVTNTLPPHRVPRLRRENAPELRLDPYVALYYYAINTRRPPLDDPRVRLALALSVDRESLVESVTQAEEIPAHHIIPPYTAGYRPGPRFEPDLDRARALLAEAGFPNGDGFPRLEILYNTLEVHRSIAEALQQMWRTRLGIDLTLHNQEWQVYLTTRRNGDFDLARAGWVASHNDPSVFTNLFMTDSGNNDTGWKDPEFDRIVRAARHEPDPERRLELFHQAEAMLVREMPIIPLYFYTTKYLLHTSVRNWHPTPLDIHPLKHVFLASPE